MTRRLLLSAIVLLVTAAPAAAQAPLPPTLSVYTAFAPPEGIARDAIGTSRVDRGRDVAVDGDRVYTVGDVRMSDGTFRVGIVARRLSGGLDSGFSGDGKLLLENKISPGAGSDLGVSVVVLPTRELRVLASAAVTAGSTTQNDIAILGFRSDGSVDPAFGTDGPGTEIFAVGPGNDVPTQLALAPDGRLAVSGYAVTAANKEDSFVSLRAANGAPAPGFGEAGVRLFDAALSTLRDHAIDVVFRPGGGLVTVLEREANATDWQAVLRGLDEAGGFDSRFAGGNELVLAVGDPDTFPGSVVVYDDKLWVTGWTLVGQDNDAFLARVDAAGGAFEFRRFDFRGTAVRPTDPVTSNGVGLAFVAGPPPTLVVSGTMTHSSSTGTRQYWGAAAFNDLQAALPALQFGDLTVTTADAVGFPRVAPAADGSVAMAGELRSQSNTGTDTTFALARLLVDADKTCDLALQAIDPLELSMTPGGSTAVTLRVTNAGTKACGGQLTVAGAYQFASPVSTGVLSPGATFTSAPLQLRHVGPRLREDLVFISVTAPGDANPRNDQRAVRVQFDYCDLTLRSVGTPRFAPTEGGRRYEMSVGNVGTTPCRDVRVGVARGGLTWRRQQRFTLQPGRSASVRAGAAITGGRPGQRATLVLRALAAADAEPGNDRATVSPTLLGVGDSRIRRFGRRGFAGRATGGRDGAARVHRRHLRVRRVEVAVQRLGKRCRPLTSRRGGLGRARSCSRRTWIRARGTRSWRLRLRRALPPGRYVTYSRAIIGAGFPEAFFSAKDGNRRSFRVR